MINKIAVVNNQWIALIFVLVDNENTMFARIVGNICDKRKQQPRIVAVYWLLERQIYWKYLNNIQCEGLAVWCRFRSLQRKMYAEYVKNQQHEKPAVNDKIKKLQ